MKTINDVVLNNLCTSCGICKAVCPKKCITYKNENGQYVPVINDKKCISCGICLDTCPGYQINYPIEKDKNNVDFFVGNYKKCYISYYKNIKSRLNSSSGGMIMGLVQALLLEKEYDCAFLVDTFNYENFVSSKLVLNGEVRDIHAKSRYVSVSMENLIAYMLNNKQKKIIIVAVSCAISGIVKVIDKYHLQRENYLLLGLFCELTFSYKIYEYFCNEKFHNANSIEQLIFKSKEKTGWPGNVKLISKNGEVVFCEARDRMLVKKYFQLERCLYCIDKLNQFADISFGDNYTNYYSEKEGTSCVIVRTTLGEKILNKYQSLFVTYPINISEIIKSQKITDKLFNLKNAKILLDNKKIDLYPGLLNKVILNKNDIVKFQNCLNKINVGRKYPKSRYTIKLEVKKQKIKSNIVKIVKGKLK